MKRGNLASRSAACTHRKHVGRMYVYFDISLTSIECHLGPDLREDVALHPVEYLQACSNAAIEQTVTSW